MRLTRAQRAENRIILLAEIRDNAPEMADELEAMNAGLREVRLVLSTLYGERNVITRQQAQLRREAYEQELSYIRETYHVPAVMGRRVRYWPVDGRTRVGRIVGTDGARLLIRFSDEPCALAYHPTYRLDYLDGHGVRGV